MQHHVGNVPELRVPFDHLDPVRAGKDAAQTGVDDVVRGHDRDSNGGPGHGTVSKQATMRRVSPQGVHRLHGHLSEAAAATSDAGKDEHRKRDDCQDDENGPQHVGTPFELIVMADDHRPKNGPVATTV